MPVVLCAFGRALRERSMDRGNPNIQDDSIHDDMLQTDATHETRSGFEEDSHTFIIEAAGKGHEPQPAMLEIILPPEKPDQLTFNDRYCPQCRSRLAERMQFGWCQRCGYCSYLDKREPLSQTEYNRLTRQSQIALHTLPGQRGSLLPQWLGVMVGGLLVGGLFSYIAGSNLRYDPAGRHWWCMMQAYLGLAMMVVAHVAAFAQLVPSGRRWHHAILFFSPLLWWAAWKRLPDTGSSVWLASWGGGLIVGAAALYAVFERPEWFEWAHRFF
jgi:LPXTG-motif cell wall-anchored protein